MKRFCRTILVSITILLPVLGFAADKIPSWQIVPDQSGILFTATQNSAPVTGEFKNFTGDMQVDPDHLKQSHINIIIDLNSVSTSYKDVADTLKTSDWFDVKVFPKAEFKSTSFEKVTDKHYEVKGLLTIRDKTVPITLTVIEQEFSPQKARVMGTTTLKRSDFGVGRGDWAKLDEVKDAVKVDFTISAIKK